MADRPDASDANADLAADATDDFSSSIAVSSSPPGSSPGMVMRSGRKKKRGPSSLSATTATPSTKREAKRSKLRHLDEETTNADAMDEVAAEQVETMDDEFEDAEMEETADRDAVAATTDDEGTTAPTLPPNETPDEGNSKRSPVASPVDPVVRLVAHGLRLPSQRTPKPQPVPVGCSPAPPGERRLVFDAVVAASSSKAFGALAKEREQRGMQREMERRQPSQKLETRQQEGSSMLQTVEPPSPFRMRDSTQARTPTNDLTKEIVSFTSAWFLLLFAFYALLCLGNTMNIFGGSVPASLSVWDVTEQSAKWSAWYGVRTRGDDVSLDVDENVRGDGNATRDDEAIQEEKRPEPKIVEIVDPDLLQRAKAKLRAQRRNEYEIQKLEAAMARARMDLETLDSLEEDWKTLFPELSTLSSSSSSSLPSSSPSRNIDKYHQTFESLYDDIAKQQKLLSQWEKALGEAEEIVEKLFRGGAAPHQVNEALTSLSNVSMMPALARVLDVTQIAVPGEGCEGKDYIPLEVEEEEEEDENIVVVGGMDVDALDYASDVPVRWEDAQTAYDSLVKLAQSTSEALMGSNEPSVYAQQWIEQIIKEECKKEGVDGKLSLKDDIDIIGATVKSARDLGDVYTAREAVRDIDRLLEIEDADRTGKFDYASVIHGARVLRRGPYATSLSLYETLPVLNRFLAYAKLRFYGHPPEVALRPTTPMHARGQCWSFLNEWSHRRSSSRSEITQDGIRGEYATLTVSLASAVSVTEVVLEHLPSNLSSNAKTAVKDFRVVGYEDGGAFGEPWELGTFQYDLNGKLFFVCASNSWAPFHISPWIIVKRSFTHHYYKSFLLTSSL